MISVFFSLPIFLRNITFLLPIRVDIAPTLLIAEVLCDWCWMSWLENKLGVPIMTIKPKYSWVGTWWVVAGAVYSSLLIDLAVYFTPA